MHIRRPGRWVRTFHGCQTGSAGIQHALAPASRAPEVPRGGAGGEAPCQIYLKYGFSTTYYDYYYHYYYYYCDYNYYCYYYIIVRVSE